MPISIDYDPEKNVLYSKAAGDISIEDIMAYYSKIERLDLKPGYSVLADYTEAGIDDIGCNEIARMVERRRRLHREVHPVKIAAVAKSDLVFGMAKMYQAMIGEEPVDVNVFRDQEKALQWLDIPNI